MESIAGSSGAADANGNRKVVVISDLPNEIIHKILRFMSFETVAKKRIVSKRFNEIGSAILNSEFQTLRNQTQHRFQSIKAQMPRRESARRKHPLARESDIIETLHMRLTLLQMTFSKHIERMHCCFFAGEILDEVHRIVRYVRTTPNLSRAYKVTDELFDLSTMAMEYFKEHIEPTLPEINYFGVADYFLDYSPTLTGSPQTQLSLMDSPASDMRQSSSLNSNKKKSTKETDGVDSVANRKNENALLKRRIRNLEVHLKRSNSQILTLKREVRISKKKSAQQQRISHNLRSRFDDYDKKFENTNRKLSAVLEELSKCKTELQYWRSKSPANATPTPVKGSHCRCELIPENDSLLLPDVFQPINENIEAVIGGDAPSTSGVTDDNNEDVRPNEEVRPIACRLEAQCKRKLNYFDESKCKLRKT